MNGLHPKYSWRQNNIEEGSMPKDRGGSLAVVPTIKEAVPPPPTLHKHTPWVALIVPLFPFLFFSFKSLCHSLLANLFLPFFPWTMAGFMTPLMLFQNAVHSSLPICGFVRKAFLHSIQMFWLPVQLFWHVLAKPRLGDLNKVRTMDINNNIMPIHCSSIP